MLLFISLFLGTYLCDYYSTLGVSKDASEKDIKKSFRRLALDLHPDKIPQNATIEYKLAAMNRFIEVQQSYETLSDPEKRVQYDLSLDGVQYDIVKENDLDRYTTNSFYTFLSSKKFKFHFSGSFSPPAVPELNINLHVDLKHVYTGTELKHTFYRRVVCSDCHGNGGVHGQCRACSLCGGTGQAVHLSDWVGKGKNAGKISSMTKTRCGACRGKGCIASGTCETCQGIGTVMQETEAFISLPAGFNNGYKMTYEGTGHQRADGSSGVLNFFIWYRIPYGWRIEDSLNLKTELPSSLDEILKGFEKDVVAPSGDTIHVSCPKGLTMANISEGIAFVYHDMGLVDLFGHQGQLIVEVTTDVSRVSPQTILDLLQASGLDSNSLIYRRILSLITDDQLNGTETDPMTVNPGDISVRTVTPQALDVDPVTGKGRENSPDEVIIELDGPKN